MARTSIAFKLQPVHIIRPLDEVHINCHQDIELICNDSNIYVENNFNSDITKEFSQTILDDEEKNDETLLPRRLSDMGSDTEPKSRSFSIKIGLRVTPKTSKELGQQVKDNTRFLNYGPNMDTCLWNAYDTKQVSSQCASALTRVNAITDYPIIEYTDEPEYMKRTSISISISLLTLLLFALGCMLIRELCSKEESDIESDQNSDNDEVDSEQYGYRVLEETNRISQIAAHMKPTIF